MVQPVYKTDDRTNVANNSIISMNSNFSNIFEYAMLTNLESHLERNYIITSRQHGFHHDSSTILTVNSFINYVSQTLDRVVQWQL